MKERSAMPSRPSGTPIATPMMMDRRSLATESFDVESVFTAGGGVTTLLKANDAVVAELFEDAADVVDSVEYADVSGAVVVSTTVTGVGVASSGI